MPATKKHAIGQLAPKSRAREDRAPGRSWLSLAGGSNISRHSPARALQQSLADQLEERQPGRWSKRRTMLFVLAVCGGFWTLVGVGVAAILR